MYSDVLGLITGLHGRLTGFYDRFTYVLLSLVPVLLNIDLMFLSLVPVLLNIDLGIDPE